MRAYARDRARVRAANARPGRRSRRPRSKPGRHDRRPAGKSPAPPREGPQDHGPGRPPGRRRARRVHLRHHPGGRGDGGRRARGRPAAGQRGGGRPPAGSRRGRRGARDAGGGLREVLIDVNVGLPRCGCAPADAGRLADAARALGLTVRGVMGYEGHLMMEQPRADRRAKTEACMDLLLKAHDDVGGEVISGGGTGTYDLNTWVTELQAGSYVLMDTAYGAIGLPFRQALFIEATVISVSPGGWAVADCGLKALGMDHGDPSIEGASVWFCSDEHLTFSSDPLPPVGARVRVTPAHVDPTVAYHERMHLLASDGEHVAETWAVDLRGW